MNEEGLIPEIWVNKIAAYLPVSSVLLGLAQAGVTNEDRARWAAAREAREAYEATLRDLLTTTDNPVIRAVAELHKADAHGDCEGCDFGGYECEPDRWPCRTSVLLGALLGIEEPA